MNSIHGYFTDRKFNVLGVASTSLPDAIKIYADTEIEEIEAGVSTFEATLSYKKNNSNHQHNTSFVEVGNFFLFQDEDGNCKWYTILKTKKDRKKKSIWFYGEDAGLDLLNEIVTAYTADKAYPISFYIEKFTYDSGFEIGLNELGDSLQRALVWEGTATATQRILSVCTQFDHAELSFSFEVSNNRISKKFINIHKKRGAETNLTLSLDRDVENIVTTESILNLRTGLRCFGGTPEGSDSPLTLRGFSYDDGTFYVQGDKVLNRVANQIWTRYLTETGDDEGYIVGLFEYDTLSQSELCNRAVNHLKSVSEIEQNFEVSISKLPDNVRIGDTVHVVDADDNLFLEARILKLEKSRSNNKAVATLGDYLIKSSNISARLKVMADAIQRNRRQTEIVAANGTKVNTGREEPESKKVGDIWFRENPDGTVDTVRWDGTNWTLFASDIEGKNIAQKADQALQDVADAKHAADEAFNKGLEAIAAGKEAEIAAEAAKELAEQAAQDAEEAKSAADAIAMDVEGVKTDVSAIAENVSTISDKAEEAYGKATAVEEQTATLETSVNGITGRLTDIEETADGTARKVNELEVTVDGQRQTIASVQETADSALNKANVIETTVDGVKQTLTSVEEWQNDFNVGTRNYIPRSNEFVAYTQNSTVGTVEADGSLRLDVNTDSQQPFALSNALVAGSTAVSLRIINNFKTGDDITFSIWLKGAVTQLPPRGYIGAGMGYIDAINATETMNPNVYTRYDYTFKYNLTSGAVVPHIQFNNQRGSYILGMTAIYKSNMGMDWSPAPEDKATVTKVNQIESTVNGTIQTVSQVKETADSALAKATQVETTAEGLKTTVSAVETTATSALTKATQVEQTANGIRQTVTEVQSKLDITDIKTAIAGGLVITDDPEFRKGNNGLAVYNNAHNGVVTMARETGISGGTQPTNSNARMRITVTGAANPQFGGILRLTQSRVNAKFVIRFTALLPIGRRFMHANNSLGDGARVTWLTSTAGTGLWTEYMYLVECGTGGTFSTFGHLYVLDGTVPTAANPLNWYIARYEIIDISQSQQSQITQLSDNINLKVEKNDVVNQINISTEGILIAGNKVHITGTTTIDNGVIRTAHIVDAAITDAKISNLSANKIRTGTLDAGIVNVINLNADNIKSGKISAIDIVGSSFTNAFSYTSGGVTYTGTTVMQDGNVIIRRTGSDGSVWVTRLDRELGFEDNYQVSATSPARITRLGMGRLFMAESGVGGYLPARALNASSWVNLPYAAGWTTSEGNPCQYRIFDQLDGSKLVRFRGQFTTTSGTMAAGSHRPFGVNSFPAAIRPNRTEFSWGLTNTRQGGRLSVTTTGDFQFQVDFANTYCSISQLSYIIE